MPKKKKPYGNLNYQKISEGLIHGKRKVDIATECGSLAKTTEGKINSVNRVINSKEFQELCSEKILMAKKAMTQDKLEATNAVGLSSVIERLSKVGGVAVANGYSDSQTTKIDTQNVLIQYGFNEVENVRAKETKE